MSKLLRLYNSWDQYVCDDFGAKDEVMLSHIKRSTSSQLREMSRRSSKSSRASSESFYASSANLDNAVVFSDVKMSYGQGKKRVNVLRGINMKVPEGAIYALLGPSGCGKTTLCNCITGRNRPTSGSVSVFGQTPGTPGSNIPGPIIGYMPQEIALFPDFTIEETLLFFSKLYRLDPGRAGARVDFLVDFLELPDKQRMVANLSGGQQRRVSLAAALIHSPPLLILDEPTVGVDPVLRQVIWDYLVLLSTKEQLSIIITTHYIEEARAANVCGLMRQGRLLVEESPEYLMDKYKAPTLEAVFLQLSRASDQQGPAEVVAHSGARAAELPAISSVGGSVVHFNQINANHNSNINNNNNLAPLPEHSAESGELGQTDLQTGAVKAQDAAAGQNQRAPTMKQIAKDKQAHTKLNQQHQQQQLNNQQLTRHKMPNGEPIQGVVNGRLVPKFEKFEVEDKPRSRAGACKQDLVHSFNRVGALTSKNFARLMRNLPVLLFQFLLPSVEVILFCLCIGQEPFNLPVSIFNQEAQSLGPDAIPEQALSLQFLNKISNHSVIKMPYATRLEAIESVRHGDSWAAMVIPENFTQSLKLRLLMNGQLDNETLASSTISLHLDMSNYLIGLQLQRLFLQAFQAFASEALEANNMSQALAQLPIQQEEPVYGIREPTFTEFMAPGVLLSIAFLAAVSLTAIALVQERKEGSLERSLVAGVSSTEFILSHVITQLLVLHVQIFFLLIFTFLVFEIPSSGPFILVITLTLLQSACGMTFGLMISASTDEETSATMLALGSFYPNLLLSGTVWPTQAMPDAMRYFAYCLPQTLPIESLRYILSRGWDITHPEVATGFAVTIGWTLFFLIAAIVIFKARV